METDTNNMVRDEEPRKAWEKGKIQSLSNMIGLYVKE